MGNYIIIFLIIILSLNLCYGKYNIFTPHKISFYILLFFGFIYLTPETNHLFSGNFYLLISGICLFFIQNRVQTMFEVFGLLNTVVFKHLKMVDGNNASVFMFTGDEGIKKNNVEDVHEFIHKINQKILYDNYFIVFCNNIKMLYYDFVEDKKSYEIEINKDLKFKKSKFSNDFICLGFNIFLFKELIKVF